MGHVGNVSEGVKNGIGTEIEHERNQRADEEQNQALFQNGYGESARRS
jgi:hypothetical protein